MNIKVNILNGLFVCHIISFHKDRNNLFPVIYNPPDRDWETEITDVNNHYLKNKKLHLIKFGRGYSWFDTGVADSLLNASNYVQAIQNRQGLKIFCIEETAHYMDLISDDQLRSLAAEIKNPDYSNYLYDILNKEEE